MIVTITPTVMDGTVLRWYAADDDTGRHPVMSVSRNRVAVYDQGLVTPEGALAAAEAHAALRCDRYADVRRYATHYRTRRTGLVPITKAGD
jgi:hypothetical protein